MPDTKQDRSKLFSQVKKGLSKSFDKAKTKAPVKRGQQLPGGIVNGHATLSSWNISKTEDKKVPFLSITGIVTLPEEHEGARATVTHYLQPNDWNTWDDITMNLVSDLKLMGAEIDELDLDDLPDLLDNLCKEKPEFVFNTRTGKRKSKDRDPMVYVSIQGLVGDEEASDTEAEGDEDDEEADAEGEDSEESEGEEDSEEEGDEEGDTDEEAEDDEPAESVVPEKGDACNFKTSPKKVELVEILRVFKDKETVNLKVSETGKIFKDVPWAKLIWEEQE
jgi:hypothetical protein